MSGVSEVSDGWYSGEVCEAQHLWQPGDRAILRATGSAVEYEVTVVRMSRARYGAHRVMVKRQGFEPFTIHEQFLRPVAAQQVNYYDPAASKPQHGQP